MKMIKDHGIVLAPKMWNSDHRNGTGDSNFNSAVKLNLNYNF